MRVTAQRRGDATTRLKETQLEMPTTITEDVKFVFLGWKMSYDTTLVCLFKACVEVPVMPRVCRVALGRVLHRCSMDERITLENPVISLPSGLGEAWQCVPDMFRTIDIRSAPWGLLGDRRTGSVWKRVIS